MIGRRVATIVAGQDAREKEAALREAQRREAEAKREAERLRKEAEAALARAKEVEAAALATRKARMAAEGTLEASAQDDLGMREIGHTAGGEVGGGAETHAAAGRRYGAPSSMFPSEAAVTAPPSPHAALFHRRCRCRHCRPLVARARAASLPLFPSLPQPLESLGHSPLASPHTRTPTSSSASLSRPPSTLQAKRFFSAPKTVSSARGAGSPNAAWRMGRSGWSGSARRPAPGPWLPNNAAIALRRATLGNGGRAQATPPSGWQTRSTTRSSDRSQRSTPHAAPHRV